MKTFGCKNEDCGCVVEVEGRMAFGRGELDKSNHWEIPCAKCARAFEKRYHPAKDCWPVPEPEKTEVQIEMERFGAILQSLTVGAFGGFLTIRPKTTGKPTKVFIWKLLDGSAHYVDMQTGKEIEEVVLA